MLEQDLLVEYWPWPTKFEASDIILLHHRPGLIPASFVRRVQRENDDDDQDDYNAAEPLQVDDDELVQGTYVRI